MPLCASLLKFFGHPATTLIKCQYFRKGLCHAMLLFFGKNLSLGAFITFVLICLPY